MIPNFLSLLRLAIGPLLFLELSHVQRLVVVVLAGITDGLDGWLARRLGQSSRIGAVLDPICDKGFALCALGFCWQTGVMQLPLLVAMLARELALGALVLSCAIRSAAGLPSRLYVGTCLSSKLFTTVQFGVVGAAVLGWEAPLGVAMLLWTLALGALFHWLRASSLAAKRSRAGA
jgi:cardiolipin synthase